MMNWFAHPVTRLVFLGFLAGIIITALHLATRQVIQLNQQQYRVQQLRELIDPAEDIRHVNENLYITSQSDLITGFIFSASTEQGYNGVIRAWIAIDLDNQVRGVRVYAHDETPGIGDKIDITVSPWITTFNEKTLHQYDWRTRKSGGDFDHITGATITSRALIHTVKSGLMLAENEIPTWRELARANHE